MDKRKPLFCWDCGKKTVHDYVSGESVGSSCDFIPTRVMTAVLTFGVSEIKHTKYWECSQCGKIKRE